jgi:hypothetical protein
MFRGEPACAGSPRLWRALAGGDASAIAEVAEGFIAAFPDVQVFMDDLVLREDGVVEYHWTSLARAPKRETACAFLATRSGRSPRTA